MNHSFGPWTTAMDSGSGAQLSTFWKKRMTMLPIVRHSSAVVTRRGRLLLTATATLALILPTLHLSRTVAAIVAEPEKPVAEGTPFRVMLPGGLTAEVIGVGHNPSKGQPWCAPDATLGSDELCKKIGATGFELCQKSLEYSGRSVFRCLNQHAPGTAVRNTHLRNQSAMNSSDARFLRHLGRWLGSVTLLAPIRQTAAFSDLLLAATIRSLEQGAGKLCESGISCR